MRIVVTKEVKKMLGNTTFTLIYNNEDYLIDVKEIEETELVAYVPYKIDIMENANIQIRMYGFNRNIMLQGIINVLEKHNGLIICKIEVALVMFKELFEVLNEIKKLKQKKNMRREERIICDEMAFALLRLEAKAHVVTENAFFYARIKNISFSAISIIYDSINNKYINTAPFIKLLFTDPQDIILLKTSVIRKGVDINEPLYSELVLRVEENITYVSRLLNYFSNIQKLGRPKSF